MMRGAVLGELFTTFEFPTNLAAKRAWERAWKRCRYIGLFRWAPAGELERQVFVTVLGEREPEVVAEFERACRLLAPGSERTETPELVLASLRRRRERLMAEGGHRSMFRTPGGSVIDMHGNVHPLRRPQG